MKYIIFGGAFDPIHRSHLHKAQQTLNTTNYDRVLFMPAYGHRWGKKMTSPSHRAAMVDIAIKDFKDERLQLSMFEIDHKFNGSTLFMIRELFLDEDFTPQNVAYLIGMDHANLIEDWDGWEDLIDTVPFIVMNRVGVPSLTEWYMKWPHHMVYSAGESMSSTEVRRKLKAKEEINELTPNTLKYIEEHELYV